ncbi:hypothetical protein PUP72_02455 [Pseudomonas synxantha]|uniref:hypothetical protein n=1 Tax=Pseudomonas synxantha TaxID=47883 RepID=UPI0023677F85|nr:hypothetical protein [Pseudomonas synxantha]WDG42878.1 hypothetical protein PUP72_02455 [Pseudomonas synxantha]
MRQLTKNPALPIIEVSKEGRYWRVDWDYLEAPESKVLTDRKEFLNGYISGLLDSFGASAGEVALPSARTGTVKKLSEETAQKLAKLLTDLLHSHVKAEHRRLLNAAEVSQFIAGAGVKEPAVG